MNATPGRVWRLTAALCCAALPAVLWPEVTARAASLWPGVGESALPWLSGHTLLLWVALPVVTLSAAVLFLAPGLLLALATRRGTSVPTWCLSAVPFAIGEAIVTVTVLQVVLPAPPQGSLVGGTSLALTILTGALVATASSRRDLAWPLIGRRATIPLAAAVAAVLLGTVLLAPKLLWESFNGDGAHAFEASRLLLRQSWPFFPVAAGDIAGFPGSTSMLFTWPNAWFLGLLGPIDAAVRVPFVIYLPLLVLALHALVEEGGRPAGGRAVTALWLAVVPFVLAMAYSASYEPYHADLALPGVQDLLLLVVVLGFVHAMLRRELGWVITFALLSHLSLPNGLVLMGFWLVAELLVMRPVPWQALRYGAAAIGACLVASAALPAILAATGQPPPGGEYGFAGAVADVLHINFLQWSRFGWLLVGGAVIPVVLLARWRGQDAVARRVTVLTACYFLFFYMQARVALHHFAPAMVFPLIVALRMRPEEASARVRYLNLLRAGAVVAIVLAAPRAFAIATNTREVGRAIHQVVGPPDGSEPAVYRAASLLGTLFPAAWDPSVPEQAYGGSPLAWLRYAGSGADPGTSAYLLRRTMSRDTMSADRPTQTGEFTLVVRDSATLAAHRALRPRTDRRSPTFRVPRETLFGPPGRGTIDLATPLQRFLAR